MQEIDVTPNILKDAEQRAKEMGHLNNSITKGDGNVSGFIGELLTCSLIPDSKISNTYDYDIVSEDKHIDVKTKRTKVKPRNYYDCSIASLSTHQKCTHYIFTRVLYDYSKAWVLGWMGRDEYFNKARFLKKGDKDGDNGFIVKADCYNLAIKDLNDITTFNC
jgi:hypothetical protein|tara:strand:- start:1078 stop:1566 length:489 start_codon:yes stop_codon:yes gene_type:complete